MDESQNAVNTAAAPATESAPVEESTVDNSMEASEKTEITQEGGQDVSEDSKQESQDDSQEGESQKAVPYDRFKEVNEKARALEQKMAQIEAERLEREKLANLSPEQQVQEEQAKKAREALKKLGVITQEDLQRIQQQEAAKNMFISEMNRLESTYKGDDGMPKFVPEKVAEFMDEQRAKGNDISDPETAYKLMNFDAIVDAKAKSQKSSAYSEKQAGGMNEVSDARRAELEAAKKTGDWASLLKKRAPMPK
jgi:carboxylesterase type B